MLVAVQLIELYGEVCPGSFEVVWFIRALACNNHRACWSLTALEQTALHSTCTNRSHFQVIKTTTPIHLWMQRKLKHLKNVISSNFPISFHTISLAKRHHLQKYRGIPINILNCCIRKSSLKVYFSLFAYVLYVPQSLADFGSPYWHEKSAYHLWCRGINCFKLTKFPHSTYGYQLLL